MRAVVLFLILISSAQAYNGKRCSQLMDGKKSGSSDMVFVNYTLGFITSTGQYTTSTGKCRAIGMDHKDTSELFYVFNQEQLLLDIARGQGAYLASFGRLLKCDDEGMRRLSAESRKNFRALAKLSALDQHQNLTELASHHCH